MKILVCIKQVPDLESRFKVNGAGKGIEEADLAFRMNEYDEFAVEEAVKTKEAHAGSELVVVTLGGAKATEALKKALAMGADRAIHILDGDHATKDPFQVASLLAEATKDEDFDLIFTGQQSQDLGSGQVGILLAELLGIDAVSTVVSFSTDGTKATLQRELEGGLRCDLEAGLPLLVTCQLGLNTPRYPTLPNIMKAKKKEIKQIDVIGLTDFEARVSVDSLHPPEKKGAAQFLEGEVAAQADQLIAILKEKTSVLN